jgi:hypothetical protein
VESEGVRFYQICFDFLATRTIEAKCRVFDFLRSVYRIFMRAQGESWDSRDLLKTNIGSEFE